MSQVEPADREKAPEHARVYEPPTRTSIWREANSLASVKVAQYRN
jgi:hypothetical protein